MMLVHIAHEFAVRSREGNRLPAETLHNEGERLMDALLDLENCNDYVTDATTSSDADRSVITVELLVTADDLDTALTKFLGVARTAIHTIGGVTDGWGDAGREQRAAYRPKNVQLEYV